MDAARAEIVEQSLMRCLKHDAARKEFMDAFYDEFLASDPRIRAKFVKTHMHRQKEMLRAGLVRLIMFASGSASGRATVDDLAKLHSRNYFNIEPDMYDQWLRSLLTCVRQYDRQFDSALEKLWIELFTEGIAVMKKAY